MILQRLAEHYDRIAEQVGLAPPGYSMQKVSFCLVLQPDGRLHIIEDLRRLEGKLLRPRLLKVPGQGKPSGSGFAPCFLLSGRGEHISMQALRIALFSAELDPAIPGQIVTTVRAAIREDQELLAVSCL